MLETSAQPPEPRPALSIANRFAAVCKRAVRWIPPKARLAVLCGSLVLAVLAVYTSLSSGPATLNLVCRHNLQSADLSVSVDGKVIYTDQISDGAKKRFGIFGKRVGKTFSKSLVVASGEHAVQVHLTSAADGFDQTKVCELNLIAGKEATLLISTQQNGMLLSPQATQASSAQSAVSEYGDSVRSIFVTVIGSAVSAGIGFIVQEFLRSKKPAG